MQNNKAPDLDELWDYDQPAESQARFEARLATLDPDSALAAETMTQIGRAKGLQGDLAGAHATLDEVARRLSGPVDAASATRAQIRYLLERGRVFNSSGDRASAQPLFQKAWEAAGAAGESAQAIDAAHMLAIVAEPAGSLAWNLRAMEMARAAKDPRARRWLASLYNNIGWTYHDRGEYVAALASFEEALRRREEQGGPKQIRIARWCVARTLRSLGRAPEALEVQKGLLEECEKTGERDGFVLEEIAECLLELGRGEEAREYFARAHAQLSLDPWLAKQEPARIGRLLELARKNA